MLMSFLKLTVRWIVMPDEWSGEVTKLQQDRAKRADDAFEISVPHAQSGQRGPAVRQWGADAAWAGARYRRLRSAVT
jgi:hypothetical protein